MAVSILGCRFVYFGLHSNSIATKGGAVVKRYFKHFFIVKCKTLQAKINLVFAESISFIYEYRNNESISQKTYFLLLEVWRHPSQMIAVYKKITAKIWHWWNSLTCPLQYFQAVIIFQKAAIIFWHESAWARTSPVVIFHYTWPFHPKQGCCHDVLPKTQTFIKYLTGYS